MMYEDYLQNQLRDVHSVIKVLLMSMEEIENIGDSIAGARMVWFTGVGKSAHVARRAADTLASFTFDAHFLDPVAALHGDMGRVDTTEDLVIIVSDSGKTREIVEFGNRLDATCVLVTSSDDRQGYADYVLTYPRETHTVNAPLGTIVAQDIILNTLIIKAVGKRHGTAFAANEAFDRNHPRTRHAHK